MHKLPGLTFYFKTKFRQIPYPMGNYRKQSDVSPDNKNTHSLKTSAMTMMNCNRFGKNKNAPCVSFQNTLQRKEEEYLTKERRKQENDNDKR